MKKQTEVLIQNVILLLQILQVCIFMKNIRLFGTAIPECFLQKKIIYHKSSVHFSGGQIEVLQLQNSNF